MSPSRLRASLWLTMGLVTAVTGASHGHVRAATAPPAAPASTLRVLVKLRPALAREAEALLADPSRPLRTGQAGGNVDTFLRRHGARALAPLYPERVQARRASGLTAADLAERTRQRFPQRSRRADPTARMPELGRTYVMELGPTARESVDAVVAALAADPAVEFAEEDRVISLAYVPNDPFFASAGTWGQAYDDLWGVKRVGAPAAWDVTAGAGMTVAVVDTGIDSAHPDLAANVWTNAGEVPDNSLDDDGNGFVDDVRGWDFVGLSYSNPTPDNDPRDEHGHGTHVAGTVAAVGDNALGVIGVAWQSRVMALRGLDRSGYGNLSALAGAIVYAADNGADVVNNSWGGPGSSPTIADAVAYTHGLGAVVVAAAGNSNEDASDHYPANLAQVIAVAASQPSEVFKATFSNWGSRIDVAAPGQDILSLRAAGTTMGSPVGVSHVRADGTSMAAPHVAGVAALILAHSPSFTNEEVRQVLRVSATDAGLTGYDLDFGHGRVNAAAALAVASVLEAKIAEPRDMARLSGPATVTGLARGGSFLRSTLEYGVGATPTAWILLQENTAEIAGGALGVFDPSGLPDGTYTLRLTAFDTAGRAFSDRVRVVVNYVQITVPEPPRVPNLARMFKPGQPLPVTGVATGPSFQRFRLEWARGLSPAGGWSESGLALAGGGLAPVNGGVLATWDTTGFTQADYYTLRLTVENATFTSEARTLVYFEPDLLSPHYPRWLPEAPGMSAGVVPARDASGAFRLTLVVPAWLSGLVPPSLFVLPPDGSSLSTTGLYYGAYQQQASADFDGLPGEETIVAEANWLRVFRADGSSTVLTSPRSANFQYALVRPVDLDGDGQLELLASGRELGGTNAALLFAWRRDGQQASAAFPIAVADLNSSLQGTPGARVLAADLDGDGSTEILFAEGVSSSTARWRLFNADGTPRAGWNAATFAGYPSQAVLADLDRDGTSEIVFVVHNPPAPQVHVLTASGAPLAGWPVTLPQFYASPLAVGDLDLDGRDEIVVSNGERLLALRGDGTSLSPAWPQKTVNFGLFGPPTVVDVTGDGRPEVLAARQDTVYATYPQPASSASDGTHERDSADGQAPASAVRRRRAESGVTAEAWTVPGPQAHPSIGWNDVQLQAFSTEGTVVRSWRLLGGNGTQPWGLARVTAGDFDQSGTLDLAVVYQNVTGGGSHGWIGEGMVSVLDTGTPYTAGSDWPSLFHDAHNSAALLRPDALPPTVSVTAPAAGSVLVGPLTLSASAADDAGVAGVQFLLDGAPIEAEDTWPPYAVQWDPRTASVGPHTLAAVARDGAGRTTTSAPVAVTIMRDLNAPTAVITAPLADATVAGIVLVSVDTTDDYGAVAVELWIDGVLRTTDASPPFSFAWDTTVEPGPHTLLARAYDTALNSGDSAPVAVTALDTRAAYDPVRRAPRCPLVANVCDSGTLLTGRAGLGPEANAPNTIGATCTDGVSGVFHADESNDRIRITTVDGSTLRPGKQVRVEATVWASNVFHSLDVLDLFYAANASSPTWTLFATLAPGGPGVKVLSGTYTLPAGASQAVRAQYRLLGASTACSQGNYTDHDDLIFPVGVNQTPTADAGGPYAGGTSQPIAFDGRGSSDPDGDPLSYQWDFGDGTSGTGATPAHAYAEAGTYTVSLLVSDGAVTSPAATTTVEVTFQNQAPTAQAGGPYSGARHQPIAFDGSASSDPDGDTLTYHWDFGDGATGTGVQPTHAYATPGTYAVTLVVNDGSTDSAPSSTTATVPDQPPLVSLTSPVEGALYTAPATVVLAAEASDPDGTIALVEFFAGSTRIGEDAAPPYELAWTDVPAGLYALTARALDDTGSATTSASVTVRVNQPPAVALTAPAEGAVFTAPASITLAASASDTDGTIAQVEFLRGSVSVGIDSTSPYGLTLSNVGPGVYTLSARATDDRGAVTMSPARQVTVQARLAPTADSYVRDGSANANRNFGTATALQVRNGSSGNTRWTYVKFDTSTVPTVSSARLRLFGNLSDTTSTTVTTGVYPVSNTTWQELQITWNNRPPTGATPLATVVMNNSSTTARWYEWDVTAYLQQEKAAGRHVVTLALKNLATSSPNDTFRSREQSSNRPELVVIP